MASTKKPAAKKPAKPKTAFIPKVKSTKRDGMGGYGSSR